MIALIADATSKFWARFTEQDTTEEKMRALTAGIAGEIQKALGV